MRFGVYTASYSVIRPFSVVQDTYTAIVLLNFGFLAVFDGHRHVVKCYSMIRF